MFLLFCAGLACGLLLGAGYNYRLLRRNTREIASLCDAARRLGVLSLSLAESNRNAVQCGVQRADGAPCTLEREHLGQPHSYAGVPFERIFDGYECPLCGRK